jgi:hypothetical protein
MEVAQSLVHPLMSVHIACVGSVLLQKFFNQMKEYCLNTG